jgi:hypothetical protein
MQEFLELHFITGLDFLQVLLGLGALYVFLVLARRLLNRAAFLGNLQAPLRRTIFLLELFFEPLAVVLISTAFVLWNPIFGGLLSLLLLLLGFSHLRNYLAGRIMQVNLAIEEGKRMKFGDLSGIIGKIGRLGIFLQTAEGRHFVNYFRLINEGFSLVSEQEIGGFYQLSVQVPEREKPLPEPQSIIDLLTVTPYLDWNYKPEWSRVEGEEGRFLVKILMKEDGFLEELLALIREWGYQVRVSAN